METLNGAPQSSIRGLVPFFLYTFEMSNTVKCITNRFDHDTQIQKKTFPEIILRQMQIAFKNITEH